MMRMQISGMKRMLLAGLVLAVLPSPAQDSLSLTECHRLALNNAPRAGDAHLIRDMGQLKIENTGVEWLPSIHLNGRVSYQSDVVNLVLEDTPIPVSFPEVPRDQYGMNLDISQTLYDGGITARKKAFERVSTAAEMQQVEVDLHGIKERVNPLYFSILILQENLENLELHRENLRRRREVILSAIEGGMALEADLKTIDVEMLKIRQSIIEVDAHRGAIIQTLGLLCGEELSVRTVLSMPELRMLDIPEVTRPEHLLFDLKEATLEAGKELAARKRLPVLYAFGQTGYGKPGYNMLNNEWDSYYMVGAGIRWNIWDWNSSSRERQLIGYQNQMLQNRRAAFDLEVMSALAQEESRIQQYRETLELEREVLELQQELTALAATRLSSGTITATDYITELNREMMARIRVTTHRIRMMQSIAGYLTILGKL